MTHDRLTAPTTAAGAPELELCLRAAASTRAVSTHCCTGRPMAAERRRPRTADAADAADVRAVWHDYTARSYRCVGGWYASRDVTVPHLLGSRRIGEDSMPPLHNTIAHKHRDTRRSQAQSSPTHGESSPEKSSPQHPGLLFGATAQDPGGGDDGCNERSVSASASVDATFTMTLADKLAEQASNIVRQIHQALANNRRLYGQTLKDVRGVFAAFDKVSASASASASVSASDSASDSASVSRMVRARWI